MRRNGTWFCAEPFCVMTSTSGSDELGPTVAAFVNTDPFAFSYP